MSDDRKQLIETARYLATIPDKQDIPFDALALKASLVAKAYLAAYLGDDDEPYDFDWVKTLGCDEEDESACLFWEDDVGRPVELMYGDGWYVYGSFMGNQPQTRGDVRRLLAALGIEATT